MDYNFLRKTIDLNNLILPNSDKINPILIKNHNNEIKKGLEFFSSEIKLLNVHGFLGTGKRQFINYISDFLEDDVIKLEYYCKEATVCDDIILNFLENLERIFSSRTTTLNAKITTLNVKFLQQISTIKRPIVIILHSFDDILEENLPLVKNFLIKTTKESNIKLIISTRALSPTILDDSIVEKKIFLKALNKDIFKEFLLSNKIEATDTTYDDFYKYTRGYYYYVALSIKIIQAMKISLSEFLQKFNQSEASFDEYLGLTYINMIPVAIRNLFWFLRTIRHGLSLNALAIFEIYDEFSLEYLKTNLMIFYSDDTVYVQDYFLQNIDLSIPKKTEIKLHKYIIGIYEEQLKYNLQDRVLKISRQAMRAEIEYHKSSIQKLSDDINENKNDILPEKTGEKLTSTPTKTDKIEKDISEQIEQALALASNNKNTEALEILNNLLEKDNINLQTLVEIRLNLAKIYKKIEDYKNAQHSYELVEVYYKSHNEVINLNYLFYEITDLYYKTYKNDRAIETIKKVIYSVDTPRSLLIDSCLLLGNIYLDINKFNEALDYYKKALSSIDDDQNIILPELYFKIALINDELEFDKEAFEFYNKCISITKNNSYIALAYSNLGSCYFDNYNNDDAIFCFKKAYSLEKSSNNYEGIYYNAMYIAKILIQENSSKALKYLLEAKKYAEFINEDFYLLESSLTLGDFYYSDKKINKEALIEYFNAYKLSLGLYEESEIEKIKRRIEDMRLRMNKEEFNKIEKMYGKNF